MLKMIGAAVISAAFLISGEIMAENLKIRAQMLTELHSLLLQIRHELYYTLASPHDILLKLLHQNHFRYLDFLHIFEESAGSGKPFEERLLCAVGADRNMEKEETAIVEELAGILGSTNLEGQISALELLEIRLQGLEEVAKRKQGTHVKLYRTVGFSLGAAVFIIII